MPCATQLVPCNGVVSEHKRSNVPALKICWRCLQLEEGETDQDCLDDMNPNLAVNICRLSPLIEQHSLRQEHGLCHDRGAKFLSFFGLVPFVCLGLDVGHT